MLREGPCIKIKIKKFKFATLHFEYCQPLKLKMTRRMDKNDNNEFFFCVL